MQEVSREVGNRTATTVTNICAIKVKFEGYKEYTGRWGMAERDRKKAGISIYTILIHLQTPWLPWDPALSPQVVDICLTVYLLSFLFPAICSNLEVPPPNSFSLPVELGC